MQFGHSIQSDINSIDFSLPDVPSGLPGAPADHFRFFFGPPKLGHRHWHGSLYPPDIKSEEYYTEVVKHFNFLELNASFYRPFKREVVLRWMDTFSQYSNFRVSPKFPQSITHLKRLVDVQQQTEDFVQFCHLFGSNLGPALMQLNDKWGNENITTLENYLQTLPADLQTHVELRHPGWFENDVFPTVTDMLKKYHMGTVIMDTNDRRDVLHMTLTTKSAYIRFSGNNNHPSDRRRLEAWAAKIAQWREEGLEEVYFTLHQPFEEAFPESVVIARKAFKKLLNPDIATNESTAS